MGWLTGYKHRARFKIAFSTDGEQTNYQKQLAITKGVGANTAGSLYLQNEALNWPYDIRFTRGDGTTLLNFWREESDATDGAWWTKVDDILADADYYGFAYWGKADAVDASSGDNTFIFFDDFLSALGAAWTSVGTVSVAGGILTIGGAIADGSVLTAATYGATVAARFSAKIVGPLTGSGGHGFFTSLMSTTPDSQYWGANALGAQQCQPLSTKDSVYTAGTRRDALLGAYHTYDVIRNGSTSVIFNYDNTLSDTIITNVATDNIGLGAWSDYSAHDARQYWDWCLIRKYTANEPAWGDWGAEEEEGERNIPECYVHKKHMRFGM